MQHLKECLTSYENNSSDLYMLIDKIAHIFQALLHLFDFYTYCFNYVKQISMMMHSKHNFLFLFFF